MSQHKLRFAFTSFSCPTLELRELLSVAEELGYDGVELRTGYDHGHGVELNASHQDLRRLRGWLASSSVDIACIGVRTSFTDPDNLSANVEMTRHAIALAAAMGVSVLRVFGGDLDKRQAPELATRLAADALLEMADDASASGVNICVETHDAFSEPGRLSALLRQANHPAIGVVWDLMNPVTHGDSTIEESFVALLPWIRHVHVHDGVKSGGGIQFLPIGKGVVDHSRAMELLTDVGYEGYIAGEWIEWEPAEVHLPRELATLKRLESIARER